MAEPQDVMEEEEEEDDNEEEEDDSDDYCFYCDDGMTFLVFGSLPECHVCVWGNVRFDICVCMCVVMLRKTMQVAI